MRRAARVDANQAEIVAALRDVGCSVGDTSRVGQGFPDIPIGRSMPCPHCGAYFPQNKLIEIKTTKGILTPDQMVWHAAWRGQVAVVRTIEEALAVVGIE